MLIKIQNLYNSLTTVEKNIANVVLSKPNEVINMTVTELAEISNTAPSAITRFCKSIGVGGFTKLKLILSAETAQLSSFDTPLIVSEEDDTTKIFNDVFKAGINTLQNTFSMMDFTEIEQILDIISKAKRIVCFGVGTSSVIAIDACYRFSQLGIVASYCTDILFMSVTAANLRKGDVAICISHSGSTKATINAMNYAKEAGAVTVGITSFMNSIIASESDYSVIAFSDEHRYPVEAVSARMAHICIIDAFMMGLAKKKHKNLQNYILTRNKILSDIRY